jgi:hypothetical protein
MSWLVLCQGKYTVKKTLVFQGLGVAVFPEKSIVFLKLFIRLVN